MQGLEQMCEHSWNFMNLDSQLLVPVGTGSPATGSLDGAISLQLSADGCLPLPTASWGWERGQVEANLSSSVSELECQSAGGLWLMTLQAVSGNGCFWHLPEMEASWAENAIGSAVLLSSSDLSVSSRL